MAYSQRSFCTALALALRGTGLGLILPGSMVVPASVAAQPPAAHPHAAAVTEASQRFGIPEIWIWRVMHVESRGNRRAVSHAGAMGLMQIMPATWAMLTAKHRLGRDPFDTRANILAGAAYLRAMWDRYRDVQLMLAAYNAGPGRADAYAAGRRGLPAETIAYVAAIAPRLVGAPHMAADTAQPAAAPGWRGADLFAARAASPRHPTDAPVAPSSAAIADASAAHIARPDPLFSILGREEMR